jgi:hypothetical protein
MHEAVSCSGELSHAEHQKLVARILAWQLEASMQTRREQQQWQQHFGVPPVGSAFHTQHSSSRHRTGSDSISLSALLEYLAKPHSLPGAHYNSTLKR